MPDNKHNNKITKLQQLQLFYPTKLIKNPVYATEAVALFV